VFPGWPHKVSTIPSLIRWHLYCIIIHRLYLQSPLKSVIKISCYKERYDSLAKDVRMMIEAGVSVGDRDKKCLSPLNTLMTMVCNTEFPLLYSEDLF